MKEKERTLKKICLNGEVDFEKLKKYFLEQAVFISTLAETTGADQANKSMLLFDSKIEEKYTFTETEKYIRQFIYILLTSIFEEMEVVEMLKEKGRIDEENSDRKP